MNEAAAHEVGTEGALLNRVALAAFWIWCALFFLGGVAELLDLDWLRTLTDVKRLFLR